MLELLKIDRAAAVAAAWDLVHERGLLALSLGALAHRMGCNESALQDLFENEHAVYDALFEDGCRAFLRSRAALPPAADARERQRQISHGFARFAVADPERYQLLFQRTIPGFEPSAASYALAVEAMEQTRTNLRELGITEAAHADLFTGIIGGMVSQQMTNDPNGDRWLRLIDEALDVYIDMRDARRRLVAGQDAERRRIERDLHDGAQQQLVALKVQAGLARTLAEREGATRTAAVLAGFADEVGQALESLRDLARGIYPPLLAAEGLVVALAAAVARSSTPIDIEAASVERYAEDIEAAVYFCCLEAVQNASKYASARRATVRLRVEDNVLCFCVADDGVGFDPAVTRRGSGTTNMADRVGALGGTLVVESTPGTGTSVVGRVPLVRGDRVS